MRMPQLRIRGNAEHPLARQNDAFAHPALALQTDAPAFLGQLDDLDAHVDDVADLDRTAEMRLAV